MNKLKISAIVSGKVLLKRKDCEVHDVTYEQAKKQVEKNSPKSNTKVKYSVVIVNGEKCLKREEFEPTTLLSLRREQLF